MNTYLIKYRGHTGLPDGYVEIKASSPESAVRIIKANGGVTVLDVYGPPVPREEWTA